MRPIVPVLDHSSSKPLYTQLYDYIRGEMRSGGVLAGEKFPSIRQMAKQLGVSITTVEAAYSQLAVEGYLETKARSGYFAADITAGAAGRPVPQEPAEFYEFPFPKAPYQFDLSSFDFGKWKKCVSAVLNDYPDLLLSEADPQGEAVLRAEITRYLYARRGVIADPDDIVISAGTQQLIGHLSRILRVMGIEHIALETPGYRPVQNIFSERGFPLTLVPVTEEGIRIEKLPVNIPSAVYVCPSNQFPTGAVMPIGRRYRLLEWAEANDSIILEDDYDSELRYFGRPVPPIRSLARDCPVVYFGSFSSTLFPAVRISYMVLPARMREIFGSIKQGYDQTCSKLEQLTLAMFMEKGYYLAGLRKLRKLYSEKLALALDAIARYGKGLAEPMNSVSGINIVLKVRSQKNPEELSRAAASLSLRIAYNQDLSGEDKAMIFYYNQVPAENMENSVRDLMALWRS